MAALLSKRTHHPNPLETVPRPEGSGFKDGSLLLCVFSVRAFLPLWMCVCYNVHGVCVCLCVCVCVYVWVCVCTCGCRGSATIMYLTNTRIGEAVGLFQSVLNTSLDRIAGFTLDAIEVSTPSLHSNF